MRKLGEIANGGAGYDEMEQEEDMYLSDDLDRPEPLGGAVDLFEDDDGPCQDEADVEDGPYCPVDTLDALEFCGRLAYQIAIGMPVTPEQAAEAAGRAVKCFAYYNYEQQEWFTEAVPFMKEREPRNIRADDRLNEPHVDAGSGDKREREATT